MDNLSRHISSIPILTANPTNTVSIKVPRRSLQSAQDNGLAKTAFLSRHLAYVPIRQRVSVEASVQGTNDSIFFAPEHPNADESHKRVIPTQFIKIRPRDHHDVVRMGDDFEVEFIGMCVTPQDMFGGNDLLLCSLTRSDEAGGVALDPPPSPPSPNKTRKTTTTTTTSAAAAKTKTKTTPAPTGPAATLEERPPCEHDANTHPNEDPHGSVDATTPVSSLAEDSTSSEDDNTPLKRVLKAQERKKAQVKSWQQQGKIREDSRMKDLPTSLQLSKHDDPFIHYDPIYDGHDVGSRPDTFVPVPGTKRLYVQRKGKFAQTIKDESPILYVRFTVMEVDKLSEEQIAAIKSIELIGKSVSNAASSIPYLKVISWMLKFANYLGKSALKKVSMPDHVMSADIGLKIAQREEDELREDQLEAEEIRRGLPKRPRQEEYGNFLRYGYYFFLSKKVDARLYAQTGASSQSVALMLRRHGYNPKLAFSNEKEFFPLTGVSYVAVKVTRGCSPVRKDRVEVAQKHRDRLVSLLQKYKDPTGDEDERKGSGPAPSKSKM